MTRRSLARIVCSVTESPLCLPHLETRKTFAFIRDRDDAAVGQHTHIAHAAADLRKDRLIGDDRVAIEFEAAHLFIDQRAQQSVALPLGE